MVCFSEKELAREIAADALRDTMRSLKVVRKEAARDREIEAEVFGGLV